jgi:hypothetical protein
MNRLPPERRTTKIIVAVYPLPNPLISEEDWLRATHQDLDTMSKAQLTREHYRVECCIRFEDHPHYWLIQREERLRRLIQTRKHDD